MFVFFFFKQKTAYEMRISDWSSDVCSSDLVRGAGMIEAIQAWAARYADDRRYTPVGQVFHWTMAALILFQLGWGWWMSRIPAGGDMLEAFRVHAELGLLMLVLAVLRALWRLIVPGPINDADRLGWQTAAAYVTHILFYVCFFGLPLSGWAMWSAVEGEPLKIAGIVPFPYMPFDTLARSEEHTSELQSLMRISYAVFCLK